ANTLPTSEPIGRRPHLDLDMAHPALVGRGVRRAQAQDAVTEIDGLSRWLDGTESGKEIGAVAAGANVEIGAQRPDHVDILLERGAGVDQDGLTCLQRAIILLPHPLWRTQHIPPHRGRRVGRFVAVVIRLTARRCGTGKRAVRLKMPALLLRRRGPAGIVPPDISAHHKEAYWMRLRLLAPRLAF